MSLIVLCYYIVRRKKKDVTKNAYFFVKKEIREKILSVYGKDVLVLSIKLP